MRATFRGLVEKLEIARGHDGLFRGGPDPVLLVGVYGAFGGVARLLGRTLHRFPSKTDFPTEVTPDRADLPAVLVESGELHFVVLAIALEEDGGGDVQRIFGTLDHPEVIAIWSTDRSDVEPFAVGAFPHDVAHAVPNAIEIVIDGQTASNACKSDKWIGARAWSLEARAPATSSLYRAPFLAPNRKNDWTAVLTIEH
ncbi:MAG TPA: hypothetical protein VGH28_32910 [Polyangiaceae bacterium]|jgi:hypothetical protein